MAPAVAGGAARVGAVVGGAAVTALWATVHGWTNLKKCREGEITKQEAAQRTATESVGMGLAAGAGIAAVNVVRASTLIATSVALVPFLVGVAIAGGARAAWERKVIQRSPDPGPAPTAPDAERPV